MAEIDVVIPAHEKDFDLLRHAVRSVLRHVSPVRRVHVVSSTPFRGMDDRVRWIPEPESSVVPTIADLRRTWTGRPGAQLDRAPWIYQQLLKLAAPAYVEPLTTSYLVMDADVVFLRPVSFDPDGCGRFPYSRSWELHAPYREAYRRLFGTDAPTGHSFVAHHMLFEQSLVSEMLREIEDRHATGWADAILASIDAGQESAFSEWETYGWWLMDRHPDVPRHRQVFWQDVRVVPRRRERAVLGLDFDFVAAHRWMRQSRWQRRAGAMARFLRND